MTDDDYELIWPKVTRRLRRLCDEFGWEVVLAIFVFGHAGASQSVETCSQDRAGGNSLATRRLE
jgi:hypothetical protein